MMKHTESFLRTLLPTIDTRERITIFSKLQLLQTNLTIDEIAVNISDEIYDYSINDTTLIKDIVTPVEEIFKSKIKDKEFIRLFLKYVHLETLSKLKNQALFDKFYKNGHKLFLLSIPHMDINTTYRKWQIDNIIKKV